MYTGSHGQPGGKFKNGVALQPAALLQRISCVFFKYEHKSLNSCFFKRGTHGFFNNDYN